MQGQGSLLLVTHVHVRQGPNGLQIDDQTAAGIAQWCRHFERVTFYGIMTEGSSSSAWVDTHEGLIGERATLIGLPYGYGVGAMVRTLRGVRRELCRAIAAHDHLCFTLGLVIGDWPFVAALEAIHQKRRYAAWIDRVEAPIVRRLARSWAKRTATAIMLPITERAIRHALRKSEVALLQGGDTYAYYAASAPDPHCTYDIHTHATDEIAAAALVAKQTRVRSGAPLEIAYLGRAVAMKGPFDWLDTLQQLHRARVPFRATWIGDGPDLPAMQRRVDELGLTGLVDLPGFEDRRDVLLQRLRDSDVLLFCHKTPESARCLVESLVCGCAIVGYDSAYARGLVAQDGGGCFTAQDNTTALASSITQLHRDRDHLAQLIGDAAASGRLYNEDAVYAHRAALMKRA